MTKIKLCGISRIDEVEAVNELHPDYIGFVFSRKSRRYVDRQKAAALKRLLSPDIQAVGVFVRESVETIAELLEDGTIDIGQLHGGEPEEEIWRLRMLTDRPIIKAFSIETEADIEAAMLCSADHILLDSGKGGTGEAFDWNLLVRINRPYFLAGGLTIFNVGSAVSRLRPYAVDVSSGIETNRKKDKRKMKAFIKAVRTCPAVDD